MNLDSATDRQCLALLQEIVPCQYAQWLVEDPDNHDYQVIASVIPEGAEGYDIAHRTGVIGQVFRLEKSILVPDVRNHPLYDPFDESIDWELCFPVFVDGTMTAVVNLEGTGSLGVEAEAWDRVCQVVEETTQCQPPSAAPQTDGSCLIETRRVVIQVCSAAERSDMVEMVRAIAGAGPSVLLVGDYPDLLHGRGPTMAEASEQGLGVSYCYFGVEQRIDLLATGPNTQEVLAEYGTEWWNTCRGRYAFVLLQTPT